MSRFNKEKVDEKKRQTRIFLLLVTLVEINLALYVTVVFDSFMRGEKNGLFSYSIIAIWKILFQSSQVKTIWLFLQLLWIALIVSISFRVRPVLNEVETHPIMPGIDVPVPAGNGQFGNERFLSEQEKKELWQIFKYDGRNHYPDIPGNGGLVVHWLKKGRTEYIYYEAGEIHSIIIGASGSGKTRRLLLETLWMQINAGQSVIISDVKGEIYYYTSPYAAKRGYKTIAFDLRNPRKSVHYNFLQPILDAFAEGDRAKGIDYTWDLVSCLVGEQKGEPIWHNGECATIAAAILIVCLEAPEDKYKNLTNVYYFLSMMCQSDQFGNMPLNKYLETLSDTHPAKGVFSMVTIAADKTRSSFFTSALGTLRLFTNENVAEMTSFSDFKLSDISSEKTILYLMIPDEKQTLYPLVSLLITQLYQSQVDLANKNGLRLPIDTDYDLDEVGNFPFIPVLPSIAAAGRSRGVRMNLILQDYQQLETKYKDDFENVKTNCQLKMYLKTSNEKTLEEISKHLGDYTCENPNASTSINDNDKQSANYSSSSSLTGRALLKPSELGRVKAPYIICMPTGEFSGVNILPDLSEWYANKLFGLGDKKHNAKIVMEREQARSERPAQELILWGIWNEYNTTEENDYSSRVSFIN